MQLKAKGQPVDALDNSARLLKRGTQNLSFVPAGCLILARAPGDFAISNIGSTKTELSSWRIPHRDRGC